MTDLQTRRARLQTRCQSQRQLLALRIAEVERRVQGADAVLSVARSVLGKSAAIASGTALWWSARGTGWWSFIARGVTLLGAARRIYRVFRGR